MPASNKGGVMIHKHSIETYQSIMQDGSKETRKRALLEIIETATEPMTDYEVLQCFKSGSDNLNLVQPRITEGYLKGLFLEGPSIIGDSGKRVRTSLFNEDVLDMQMELF